MADTANFDLNELKKVGTLQQKQKEYFVLRLRLAGGDLGAEELAQVARIAREYGRGEVHLSTRQGIEIPWVAKDKVLAARGDLEASGLRMGACGPRVRVVVACPGADICRWGVVGTKTLAKKLDAKYFGQETPHKFKLSVTGCAHNCAKASENDIGIMGAILPRWNPQACNFCDLCANLCPTKAIAKTEGAYEIDEKKCLYCSICTKSCPGSAWEEGEKGYRVFIGGTVGKIPRFASALEGIFKTEEEVFAVIDRALAFYRKQGKKRERFGHTLDRVGLEEAKKEILHGL